MEYTEILPWGLLAIVLYIAVNRAIRVDVLLDNIADREDEIDITKSSYKKDRARLIEELEGWKLKATCPPISPPIEYKSVLDKTDIKIISSRVKIPQHHRYGKVTKDNHKYHQAYLKAEHDFLQQLSKYVYSEIDDKGHEIEYYQEIYVAKPKKVHYEK